MAVEAYLFMDDQFHSSNTTAEVDGYTGSNENGWAGENVREAEFGTGWKPANDTSDHAIRLDFNNTTTLGAAGTTAYVAIAYDARLAEQTTIWLQYDSADSSGFAGATLAVAFTVDTTRPLCQWSSFTVPTPAKRYWRLMERNADRGGGTRTIPIFNWAMYSAAGVYRIGTDYATDTTGPGALNQVHQIQAVMGATNVRHTNMIARPQQEFEITFRPASLALWQDLRDAVYDLDGPKRAFYVRFAGLRNPVQEFFMVRMVNERVSTFHKQADQYDVTINLVTEVCF